MAMNPKIELNDVIGHNGDMLKMLEEQGELPVVRVDLQTQTIYVGNYQYAVEFLLTFPETPIGTKFEVIDNGITFKLKKIG